MADEEQIILPERFKRVEYLENSGTQWIDTGVIPNNETGLYLKAHRINGGDLVSAGARTNNIRFYPPRFNMNDTSIEYGWENYYVLGNRNTADNLMYESWLNFCNSRKTSIQTQSNFYEKELSTTLPSLSHTIYIFDWNYNGSASTHWAGRVYEAKISQGTEIIKHFVPAFDTLRLEACMYEVKEGKAYYNKGTGTLAAKFNLEDEQLGILHKLPEGFTKVNYLIANGSQYIDTNYVPTNETGYYLEGQGYTTSETYYFGLRESTSTDSRIYFCATPNVNWGWMTYGTLTNAAANLRQETKVYHNFLNSRKSVATINETNFTYNLSELNFVPTLKLMLFNFNNGGTPHTSCGLKGRIDTFLISEGDQIVRQFVPCLDADGIPCMYELYTGTVHYNQGSGQFSYPREYTNDPINLPAGYTKCVYLQSNGTQWIDTEVIPTDETGLYLKAQHLGYDFHVPLGSVITNQIMFYPPIYSLSNKYSAYAFKSALVQMFYYDKADDLIYTSTMNLYNDRTVNLWSEDTEHHGIVTPTPNTTEMPSLWLFSWNAGTGAIHATNGKFIGRIFRAKITQGDYLIHDFVPCLDANNRPCMYDLVTQTPFYNQSGGTDFTYCIEHQLPSDFIKLKYLESTGTQIIKTGIIPTDSTGIYVDAYHVKQEGNTVGSVIGLRNTNGNTYFYVGRVQRDTNGAGFGWGAFTTPGGYGNVRYEASLNFLNDRQSIITAPAFAQRINALGTLSFTPTKDLYMFGMNNYDGAATLYSTYRIYRAKISEGSEIVRDWVPAMDNRNSKPCMYDLINNVAYYNDGTGDFDYNKDFEGIYTGFTQLCGIGNRLGTDTQTDSTIEFINEITGMDSFTINSKIEVKKDYRIKIKTDVAHPFLSQKYTDEWNETLLMPIVQKVTIPCYKNSDVLLNTMRGLEIDWTHVIDMDYVLGQYIRVVSYSNSIIEEDEYENIAESLTGEEIYTPREADENGLVLTLRHLDGGFFEMKIYNENNKLLTHLVPAKNKNNITGVYCKVRHIFIAV